MGTSIRGYKHTFSFWKSKLNFTKWKHIKMAAEPERSYTQDQLESEEVTKKDILSFLQANASKAFLKGNKLNGKLNNVAKSFKKDQAINLYNKMFETKSFKSDADEDDEPVVEVTKKPTVKKASEKEAAVIEKPKFVKKVLKKASKPDQIPRKGDLVSCFYTGKLQDGTVFDTNIGKGSKKRGGSYVPLKFKVGTGQVIRGWDEALMTMGLEEKAELTIQPEWAYGRKGLPEHKIPPNATLIFEVELANIE
ncbi:peptidyl-prolyl cis-trans isomerase FKBP3-like [Xenia sp. Carnegie-2017]|uniref:peptidyl-prolyl cis-trans isomerase FKBP3-like n=1 Tax=Xenia sp. Carnegie-2017 TaxID=2897299 RepID=UPI001F049C0B|nr:peptidyl-prolyl cis-trans isomerase FKBP3-like [Xenia sp. Carnegie-2017]